MESARRPHYQVTFGILALGIGAFSLLQSLVIPLLSTVQAELHTSQSAVTWVLTAYLLSASVMTPILGRVGDIYGKKWVFVAALAALGARGKNNTHVTGFPRLITTRGGAYCFLPSVTGLRYLASL